MIVRVAEPEDMDTIAAFYQQQGYDPPLKATDQFLIAEGVGALCGVVRVCREQGVLVLRGMRVSQEKQRRGIGSRLLLALEPLLEDNPCFCIAHAHLRTFYGQIGFVEIPVAQAPLFLQERIAGYRRDHRVSAILMARPGGCGKAPVTGVDHCPTSTRAAEQVQYTPKKRQKDG